jgi:uncharacterized LabA/DUF88 family protein
MADEAQKQPYHTPSAMPMIVRHKEKAILFMDARNIIKGQESFNNGSEWKSDFGYKEMIDFFNEQYQIIRGYYYDGAPHKSQMSDDRKKFYRLMRQWGYTLRLKEIDFSKKNPSQKGVDIYLTTDMISLAYENAYDVAILASGDGDYVALIDLVKSKGKKVWVTSFGCCISEKLRECADKVLLIEKIEKMQRVIRPPQIQTPKDLNNKSNNTTHHVNKGISAPGTTR